MLLGLLAAAGARAEWVDETTAVPLLSGKKPLWLPAQTKTARHAVARIHFWVGREGEVEAVEQTCGDRALFDEIVDAVLEWKFRRKNFTTDLSFVRRGRRVWLLLDLPRAQRPRTDICAAVAAAQPPWPGGSGRGDSMLRGISRSTITTSTQRWPRRPCFSCTPTSRKPSERHRRRLGWLVAIRRPISL